MTSINLKKARELSLPERDEVLRRAYSVQEFWSSNKKILSDAWKEWENVEANKLGIPYKDLIDDKLRKHVEYSWKKPQTENQVKDLLKEVCSGVYQFQFFSPEKIKELREYLLRAENSKIPVRPPYGIVLNRKGAMLDRRSEGYLAAPSFQSLYQEIINIYMRPIARLLFPESMGFDTQTFGFSIQYKPEKDDSIRTHTDASTVTLNINLNLPCEDYTGSEVDFHDPVKGKRVRAKFEPGTAIIHRGNIAHAAQPITSGERNNLVLWLYGDRMQTPRFHNDNQLVDPTKRWVLPTSECDEFAPF